MFARPSLVSGQGMKWLFEVADLSLICLASSTVGLAEKRPAAHSSVLKGHQTSGVASQSSLTPRPQNRLHQKQGLPTERHSDKRDAHIHTDSGGSLTTSQDPTKRKRRRI